MTTDQIYEAGKQRVNEMRRAQVERRAELARILVDYPKKCARLKEAYSLLFSLLLAGYFHGDDKDKARLAVRAFLEKEDE